MICDICGSENREGAATCAFCGAKLPDIQIISSTGRLKRFGPEETAGEIEAGLSEEVLREPETLPDGAPPETEAEIGRKALSEQAAEIVNRAVEKIITKHDREESGAPPEEEKDPFESALAEPSVLTQAQREEAQRAQAAEERRRKLLESEASPLDFTMETEKEAEPEQAGTETAEPAAHDFVKAAALADNGEQLAAEASGHVSEALRRKMCRPPRRKRCPKRRKAPGSRRSSCRTWRRSCPGPSKASIFRRSRKQQVFPNRRRRKKKYRNRKKQLWKKRFRNRRKQFRNRRK